MDIIGTVFNWVVPFLVVLTILVFVHELGHYWVARRCGVRVEVFSIGFGPEIYGWNDRRQTRWRISAIPFGGYVKMFGEHSRDEDAPPMTPEEEAVSFSHKSLGRRSAIVAAGPFANFAFAVVLLAGLYGLVGLPAPLAAVGIIQPGSAAAEAGFEPGDRVISIDGEPIQWFEDLCLYVSARPDQKLAFVVIRSDEETELTAVPQAVEQDTPEGGITTIGRLGVGPDPTQIDYERTGPLSAAEAAVTRTYGLTMQILAAVGEMITGERDTKELGGPLRIAQLSGEMAQGGLVQLIFFCAALSINLGLINLFPIPMLDGGHLVIYLLEAIRGRPLSERTLEYGFRIGLVVVLLIFVFATWNDLMNFNLF